MEAKAKAAQEPDQEEPQHEEEPQQPPEWMVELEAELEAVDAQLGIEAGEEAPPPGAAALQAKLDWLVGKVGQLEAEAARNEEAAERRKAMVDHWLLEENGSLENSRRYLEGRVKALVGYRPEALQELFGTKKKSVSVPSGSAGFRASRATVEVEDEEAALEFCKANGVEHGVKEYVKKTPLTAHIEATGEEVPGVRFIHRSDSFFVKPAKS